MSALGGRSPARLVAALRRRADAVDDPTTRAALDAHLRRMEGMVASCSGRPCCKIETVRDLDRLTAEVAALLAG